MNYSEDRVMNIWAAVIGIMTFVGLPLAILWGMHASYTERHQVQKPVPFYNLAEYSPTFEDFESTEHRELNFRGIDNYYRTSYNGKWYFNAHHHTYRAAQTIEGVLLGTEGTNINYITEYGATSVCQHGEYNWIKPRCCFSQ